MAALTNPAQDGARRSLAKSRTLGGQRLTEQQRALAVALADGCRLVEAGRRAGYADQATAWNTSRLPQVIAAVRAERQRIIQTQLGPMAIGTIRSALEDETLPLKDKFPFVKLAVQMAGDVKTVTAADDADKSLEDMDDVELMAVLGDLRQQIVDREAARAAASDTGQTAGDSAPDAAPARPPAQAPGEEAGT